MPTNRVSGKVHPRNVTGPNLSVNNELAVFNGTSGKEIKATGTIHYDGTTLFGSGAAFDIGKTTNLCRLIYVGDGASRGVQFTNGSSNGSKITSIADGMVEVVNSSGVGGTMRFQARTASQITSSQNNYNPGGPSKFQRWNSDASRNVTGLAIPGGNNDGQEHVIVNVGAQDIVLTHEDAASTATNRFLCSTGASITLSANQAADIIYDNTTGRWRVFKRN